MDCTGVNKCLKMKAYDIFIHLGYNNKYERIELLAKPELNRQNNRVVVNHDPAVSGYTGRLDIEGWFNRS